jgi:nitrile hydratase
MCSDGAVDGVHDLGGLTGFGPVTREATEPVFHERWEGRVFGIAGSLVQGGHLHGVRHAIERMDGVHYLTSPYYEHWMTAVASLLVEAGVISADDLIDRAGSFPLARPLAAHPVPAELMGDAPTSPRFDLGSSVRVRNVHSRGHTRCPDYVRDRVGEVVRVDPVAAVPELDTHHRRRVMESVYSVRFGLAELWGEAEDGASIFVDLFERYLEPAS